MALAFVAAKRHVRLQAEKLLLSKFVANILLFLNQKTPFLAPFAR
jgi:hypothetical protein